MSEIGRLTQKLDDDVAKADVWVNGGKNDSYRTTSGEVVPSIQHFNSIAAVSSEEAVSAAQRAEAAATAAQVSSGIFPTASAGLSATTNGQFFSVPSPDKNGYVILYQNNGGAAVAIKEYPSAEAVNDVRGYVDDTSDRDRLGSSIRYAQKVTSHDDEVIWGVIDELGNRTWIEASGEDGGPTSGAMNHIQRRLGLRVIEGRNDVLFAFTDTSGVVTDLALNSDGAFCDFVVESIGHRISELRVNRVAVFGSSTFAEMHPHFTKQLSDIGINDVFLGGDSGALIDSIAARLGSGNPVVEFPSGSILANTKNTVSASWLVDSGMFSWRLLLSNGVDGVLSYDATNKNYQFYASNIDNDIDVGSVNFNVTPESARYNDGVVLINAGKNNLTNSNDEINSSRYVFDKTILMTDQIDSSSGKFIVMGNFINTGQSGLASAQRIIDLNKMLKQRYGLLYFDVQEYLTSSEIWLDTGISPTSEDINQQASGELCSSLARNSGHMNSEASAAVCSKLIDRLLTLKMIKA